MRQSITALAILALPSLALAAPQAANARSRGMGGTAVASADYMSAIFTNPALLTRYDESDDWGLMLPTIGVLASDPDEMVDATEDFADEFDAIEEAFDLFDQSNNPADLPTEQDLIDLANSLRNLDGRVLNFDVDAGLGFAKPSKNLGWGIVVRSHVSGRAFVTGADADATEIENALDDDGFGGVVGLPDDLESTANVAAGGVGEYGIALAQELSLGDLSVSVGVIPKVQQVQTYNYVVDADQFDEGDSEDDFDDPDNRNEDEGFNLDVGASVGLGDELTVGLLLRNLIEREVDSELRFGREFTYMIEPRATLGAAWDMGSLTVAADIDLNETKEFDFADPSRFASLGAELAGSWAQLRVGYRTDTENVYEDVLTAGIGLSPFDTFHIDLGGMAGDDTYAATVQFSLTF